MKLGGVHPNYFSTPNHLTIPFRRCFLVKQQYLPVEEEEENDQEEAKEAVVVGSIDGPHEVWMFCLFWLNSVLENISDGPTDRRSVTTSYA